MFRAQPVSLAERIVQALAQDDACRATLSKDLGVSRTTLNRALVGLMDVGFVAAVSRPDGRQGRPPELLHLDRSVAYTAGLALSKQVGRGVIVNRVGEVLVAVQREVTTPSRCDALRDLCDALLAEARNVGVDPRVRSVGVGVPVPVPGNCSVSRCARRIIEEAFPGSGLEIPSAGGEVLGDRELSGAEPTDAGGTGGICAGVGGGRTAVSIDNIVTMAAIGEAYWGAGMAVQSLLYIQMSAGIGSCLVTPQIGTGGVTGVPSELGHTLLPGLTGTCFCGKVGCLETAASVSALLEATGAASLEELVRLLEEEKADGKASSSEGVNLEVSDAPVHDAVVRAAHAVGLAAANAVLMTNPERVILGGPLPRAVNFFVDEVHRSLTEHLLPMLGWDVDVVQSGMDEWGAARGAASAASQLLALNHAERILGGCA